MKVIKCDSCGKEMGEEPTNTAELDNTKDGAPVLGGPHVTPGEYDLCGPCGRKVENFIKHSSEL